MRTAGPVLTVILAIIAIWYIACVPMNAREVLTQAERDGAIFGAEGKIGQVFSIHILHAHAVGNGSFQSLQRPRLRIVARFVARERSVHVLDIKASAVARAEAFDQTLQIGLPRDDDQFFINDFLGLGHEMASICPGNKLPGFKYRAAFPAH